MFPNPAAVELSLGDQRSLIPNISECRKKKNIYFAILFDLFGEINWGDDEESCADCVQNTELSVC